MQGESFNALSPEELGAMGGYARAEKLTPERRSEIAKEAAGKRWGKPSAMSRPDYPIVLSLSGVDSDGIKEITKALDKIGFYLIRIVDTDSIGIEWLKSGIVPKRWTK